MSFEILEEARKVVDDMETPITRYVVSMLAALFWVHAPSEALADLWEPYARFVPDGASDDHTAPAVPVIRAVSVNRGSGENDGVSCDYVGSIHLTVVGEDDRTPSGSLGYQLTVVDGTPPEGLVEPPYAIRQDPEGGISLLWADDPGRPIHFVVTLRAVDAAGNAGPPSKARVIEEWGLGGGCEVGARGGGKSVAVTLGLLLVALGGYRATRRRR